MSWRVTCVVLAAALLCVAGPADARADDGSAIRRRQIVVFDVFDAFVVELPNFHRVADDGVRSVLHPARMRPAARRPARSEVS